MVGLREALDKQCTALMIVVPQDVKEAYEEKAKSFKHANLDMKATRYDLDAYNDGRIAGKSAMASRTLEG